ncbi:hypothetical protein WL220_02335 [Staphylococcus capitis]|uniref:hypothetical protein n=1 Tax=Staphylococcus capitis TaxID=29388 RepID=UPI0001929382|nr:hypothetical protein [Staphylococcus capitis]EEE48879.1 hypothetical protein STACA0001_2332 [Staphylococcus capitis SK14]EGS38380.1 putative lipoprotein [Staphylococcus capitis VCU116]MCT2012964.1 hypothetical protein [Staphylococcus capitis]MEB5628116.1 hypothetical protein [Staphylococcus capitis]
MRYFKSIKKVLIPISICTLIILLIGCGKSSDGLAGREFKGVVDGKTEAIFTFRDDGTFKVVSAKGKLNAGEEFNGKYEVKKANGNKYLLMPYFSGYIFGRSVKDGIEININGKGYYVYLLQKNGEDFKLINVENGGNFNKNHDFKFLKKLEEQKNDVRLVETNN